MPITEKSEPYITQLSAQALDAVHTAKKWKPALRIYNEWSTEIENITTRMEFRRFSVVAVSGGVKVGKSTIANKILDKNFSPVGKTPETDSAVIAAPPELDGNELKNMFSAANPDIKIIQGVDWPKDVILVDTPDFDSGDEKKSDIARTIIRLADVVVIVGSSEKSYSSGHIDWCKQWRDTKTFIFVHNTRGHETEIVDEREGKKLQKEYLEQKGFGRSPIFYPDDTNDLQNLRKTIWQSGQKKHEIHQSQLLRCVNGIANDFENEYKNHLNQLNRLEETIETAIVQPWQQKLESYGFDMERNALIRKLTYETGPRIAGFLGFFLSLRKHFSPWGFIGVYLSRRIRDKRVGWALGAGSVLAAFGSRWVWRLSDKKTLKGKKIVKALYETSNNETLDRIDNAAKKAGFFSQKTNIKSEHEEIQERIQNTLEDVVEDTIEEKNDLVDLKRWKVIWNIPPFFCIAIIFYSSLMAFIGTALIWEVQTQPLHAAFYLHAGIILVSVLWFESWLVSKSFHKSAENIKVKTIESLTKDTSMIGGVYASALEDIETTRDKLNNVREMTEECCKGVISSLKRDGYSV